jgi:hypothetical protein
MGCNNPEVAKWSVDEDDQAHYSVNAVRTAEDMDLNH